MKWSKKQQAKWDKKNMDKSTGHAVNNEEELWAKQEAAFEKLKKNPQLLAAIIRMKDR